MKCSMDGIKVSLGGYPPIDKPFTAMIPKDRQAIVDFFNVCKERGHRFEISMPCGYSRKFASYDDIPLDDLPCGCGRDDHYLIRYKKE